MNIAIVGPPGSGKTKFANKIKSHLNQQNKGGARVAETVDGYAQKLAKSTDLALGPWSNWSESYMVAGVRRAEELKVRRKHEHVITVGTILDTMYYCGITAQAQASVDGNTDQTRLAIAAAMGGIGVWFRSDWDYDIAFTLAVTKGDNWVLDYAGSIPDLAQSLLIDNLYGYESADDFDPEGFDNLIAKIKQR